MKYRLLHTPGFDPAPVADALASEDIGLQIAAVKDLNGQAGVPTVLLLDPTARTKFTESRLRDFYEAGGGIVALGAPGETDVPQALPDQFLAAFVAAPVGPRRLLIALRRAYREVVSRAEAVQSSREIGELTRIGLALSTERDYNTLLDMILSQARQITNSDAGSLYLVETSDEGQRRLRFKLAQNYSRPEIPLVEFTIPIDKSSIAGYVATTGEPLVIEDVYQLPSGVEYAFNRSIDQKYGYRTKSLLTIPMKDHKEEVIGVLQLINRKHRFETKLDRPEDAEQDVTVYTPHTVELVSALGGQAAVSIENSRLYESIERLFEGFVTAAVTAIEQRDPTTFGHSGRVAEMTVGLAEVVDRAGDGSYKNVKFSREELKEIRYAGLLHDFGKVGVREQVLVKAKKLYPPDLSLIRERYAFIKRTAERDFYAQRVDYLESIGHEGYEQFIERLTAEHHTRLNELDRFMHLVGESNEPTVLPQGNFEELLRFAEVSYEDLGGKKQAYLNPDEVRYLSIRKGSLDERERLEIESHVSHTFRFLCTIPWTKELQRIPAIAYGHHEKLDGTGYPRKITSADISIQTRMMTISDIFDALTASDRPYKRAVPLPRALDIMAQEVKGGMLDPELFRLFTEGQVFQRTLGESTTPTVEIPKVERPIRSSASGPSS